METEQSVPCVVQCAPAVDDVVETNSKNNGSAINSSSTNNNNIEAEHESSTKSTNNAIVIDDDASRSAMGTAKGHTIENCDNDKSGVAVSFAEIHLNNNESIIGFVDDEEEAVVVGETAAVASSAETDEGACCKPDTNNCGIDAAAVDDGKCFVRYTVIPRVCTLSL